MEGHSARQRFWALLSRLTKVPIRRNGGAPPPQAKSESIIVRNLMIN